MGRMLVYATLPGATAPGYPKTAPLGRGSFSNVVSMLFIRSSLLLGTYWRSGGCWQSDFIMQGICLFFLCA